MNTIAFVLAGLFCGFIDSCLGMGFVELHGGEIWVESEGKEEGSTFCFMIPSSG